MSSNDLEQPEAESTATVSPGAILMTARESAGLSREYVAKELHMTLSRIQAIESDDYTKLNVDTYIRGYLRSYASLLKIDAREVIAAYERDSFAEGLPTEPQYVVARDASPKKVWHFVTALIVLLAGLWLITVWFFDNQSERPEVSPPPVVDPATSLPAEAASAAGEAAMADSVAVGSDVNAPENGAATDAAFAAAGTENAVAAEAPTVETSTAEEKTLDTLHLTFARECWLEVSDAQGDVLATELQREGSSLTLSGIAPFNVKLGDATAVSMTLNGEAVDIAPPAGGKVKTFKVGN